MAPPPVAPPAPKGKPKAKPSRGQVQTEIASIVRDAEQRLKRSEHERQVHDAMLTAIFKAIHEDSVPESYLDIYSTDTKDTMGCDIFLGSFGLRSLPVNVQDDLMR